MLRTTVAFAALLILGTVGASSSHAACGRLLDAHGITCLVPETRAFLTRHQRVPVPTRAQPSAAVDLSSAHPSIDGMRKRFAR